MSSAACCTCHMQCMSLHTCSAGSAMQHHGCHVCITLRRAGEAGDQPEPEGRLQGAGAGPVQGQAGRRQGGGAPCGRLINPLALATPFINDFEGQLHHVPCKFALSLQQFRMHVVADGLPSCAADVQPGLADGQGGDQGCGGLPGQERQEGGIVAWLLSSGIGDAHLRKCAHGGVFYIGRWSRCNDTKCILSCRSVLSDSAWVAR
jgi:hypothetical protein